MRAVIQRVTDARVEIDGAVAGRIGLGLLVLLGIGKADTRRAAEYLAAKVIGLRVLPDSAGKMNLAIRDVSGGLLVVSQFTLYADVSRGRRPGFENAANPQLARTLYEYFVETVRKQNVPVQTGVFQASMSVHLVNEGPVTIILDTERIT